MVLKWHGWFGQSKNYSWLLVWFSAAVEMENILLCFQMSSYMKFLDGTAEGKAIKGPINSFGRQVARKLRIQKMVGGMMVAFMACCINI